MSRIKIAIALGASTVGLLLPWRARVAYSEALGWIAQLVPPSFTSVGIEPDEAERR